MLRVRTDIVKEVVSTHFIEQTELEKRNLESRVLQILAVIYSPPRSATPVDVDKLLKAVTIAKNSIDTKETELKLKSTHIAEKTGMAPYPVCCQSPFRADCQSPIPLRLTRNEFNEVVMTEPIPLLRPTPRRARTPLNPDNK